MLLEARLYTAVAYTHTYKGTPESTHENDQPREGWWRGRVGGANGIGNVA